MITCIDIKVSRFTKIILPDDANAQLTGHEGAHDDLYKAEYGNVERKVRAAVNGPVGKKYVDM